MWKYLWDKKNETSHEEAIVDKIKFKAEAHDNNKWETQSHTNIGTRIEAVESQAYSFQPFCSIHKQDMHIQIPFCQHMENQNKFMRISLEPQWRDQSRTQVLLLETIQSLCTPDT